VLLEAMVAKVPVVASDCGGASEVVADAGWLFEFGNVGNLVEVLIKSQAGEDSTFASKAYAKVKKKYSIKAVCNIFNTLI